MVKLYSISAAIRVLVDGGANHWFDFITKNQLIDCIEHPHFLTGDMDSITDASKQRLKTMNCEEIKTPDQNESDCPKSLIAIQPYLESKKVLIASVNCLEVFFIRSIKLLFNSFQVEFIEILTDFGGRIDQTMSQIDALFKHPIPNHIDIYLKSHKSIAWLLFPGNHEIIVPEVFVIRQLFCSYIPMDGSCKVTTDGLKWDLCTWFFHSIL